jgi:hypothetical protein
VPVFTHLFVLVALPPASRKSAVFADVTGPLVAVERDEIRRKQAVIVEAQTARRVAEQAAEQAKSNAGKAPADQADELLAEAIAATDRANAITVPASPRLLVDDATPEALSSLLADHGRIALMSREATCWT